MTTTSAATTTSPPALERRSPVPAWAGIALCLLLATAQVALGGYQLGVGNQAIQIAFLKHWASPWLYSTDPMVTQTMSAYPSYFFRLLAPLLNFTSLETLYLTGQIITSFLTLAAVYWLGRSIYRSHATAIAAAALLVAGHLHALAGDTLYSQGFTHTFAALPLAVAALALAYRGKWVWAFLLAGVLFNLHALTAAYTLLMLGAAMLADFRDLRRSEWLTRAVLCASIVLAVASPTLALMVANRQVFDEQWVNLMRIRSADHSFPSTWWAAGDTDVPRYLLVLALFVLSWSFSPLRRGIESGGGGGARRATRITVLMTLAVLALFAAGYVFTEIRPVPLIIRLQPFRASRLLLILMLVHVAHGAIAAIRAGAAGEAHTPAGETFRLPSFACGCEIISGILVLLTLGVPSLLPLLPLAVVVALAAALIAGHLSWRQAIVAVASLLVVFLAFLQTQFPLPFFSAALNLLPQATVSPAAAHMRYLAAAILLLAVTLGIMLGLVRRSMPRLVLAGVTVFAGCFFARVLFARESAEELSPENTALAKVSAWARQQTSTNALFLAPTGMANFRISAERSLVGDWRDGTQLYFSAAFGPQWLQTVLELEPGLTLTQDGTRLLSRGESMALASLDDEDLLALADQYQANYILLPTPPKSQPRKLVIAHADDKYTVYEPALLPPPVIPLPPGVLNRDNWIAAETFMNTTVAENIEKYRKADVTFLVIDPQGRPVQNLALKADQTKQAFIFGASLGFFEANDISPNGDLKAAPVRPVELQKAPELFNGSMIPFSSKWQYIEPLKGQYRWSDLDKYVDFCAKNNMTVEFHHLSGVLPAWVENMGGIDGQTGLNFPAPIPALQTEFNRHCLDTVARYADRIKYWQVVNEKYMMQYVPAAFRLLQAKFPNNQFGLSDCVRFWDGTMDGVQVSGIGRNGGRGFGRGGGNLNALQYKGADAVDWLINQGIHPAFFSIHGHWPLNIWADPREIYNVVDYFAQRKVKVHISEEFLQLGTPIYGPLRSGITLTPELQGEYLARLLTVAFSNPNIDMLNYWGLSPNGWGASNSGLIDASGNTRAAWEILKKLFTETWRSHAAGELSLEGAYLARVFHGTYAVSLTLPNGKIATATVEIPQQPIAQIRLQLDPDGTLKVIK